MHQHTNHDTSTQAMTEVALGLSMAFFSLLILALFSIGLPDSSTKRSTIIKQLMNSLTLADNNEKPSQNQTAESRKQQYAFYFNRQFYDKQLYPLNIDNFQPF